MIVKICRHSLPRIWLHQSAVGFQILMRDSTFLDQSLNQLTLKEPGFLDPSHSSVGGGVDSAPQDLGNRLTKHQVCGTSG